MATIFKLIIEDDEGKTTVFPLADGDLTIGRKDGNTIRLMERNVSRRHARVERTNGAVFIQDLDSYNGVKINGERISGKFEVKEGDLIEIGDYHLALQMSVTRSEAPEPAPPAIAQGGGTWPQAGTVPDFTLPDELLADTNPNERSTRDTVIDQPVPSGLPNAVAPTVQPPEPSPRAPTEPESQGRLPPFPSSGGMSRGLTSELPPASPPTQPAPVPPPAKTAPHLNPGPEAVSSMPRLICVSTNYAGKSFALTRPELIIGRVEDNDIVIEHRSVSRNHAKILYDGRTHKIIDLQSANGILVNGEEYAMTDLRQGDLIELGHVRFRFVPADEPFHPSAEEAQEMTSAGVAPPPSSPAASQSDEPLDIRRREADTASTEVPAYDPSQAATVTDAPLSALEPSVPNPIVEPAPGTLVGPPAQPPPRATEDERPTELSRMPAAVPAAAPVAVAVEPSAAVARPAPMYEKPEPEQPPRRGWGGLGAVLMVLALAAAVFWAVVVGLDGLANEGSPDDALQMLFDEQRYAEVVSFYDAHQLEFRDRAEADRLYRAAGIFTEEPPSDVSAPLPPEEPLPPDEPAELGEPTDDPVDVQPLEQPEIAEPSPRVTPPPPARPSARELEARRRRAARRRAAQVKELVERGKRLVLSGDLGRAEKVLKDCLRYEPNQPDCHRNLGVLYASQDQTPSAIKHYRRYVELRPNAADADRVRDILQRFEGNP